jgi:Xaa-Pro aminopeptidase
MYTKELTPELQLRWGKIQEQMRRDGVEALLLANTVNLFYTAGRVFGGWTYLEQEGEATFFVRRPVGLSEGHIVYVRKPEDIAAKLSEMGKALPKSIALEADSLSYSEYERLAKIFPDAAKSNASALMRAVRAVKTPYEVALMRESGVKHAAVYNRVTHIYREGMSDDELAIELESLARRLGSLGLFRIFGSSMEIYSGSILAGDNADAPSPYDFAMGGAGMNGSLPVGANGTLLKPGMTVMVDMGGNFTGYMTDMTRVFVVRELRSDLARKAHEVALEIEASVKAMARPGTPAKDIYNLALDIAKTNGLEEYFMGHRQQAGFVGHGVGIEINELPVLAPRSRDILAEGMTFALEPKFVIPGVGAVGIENTFVVTADGLEQLTICDEEIKELR